jgi:hypothetical protein
MTIYSRTNPVQAPENPKGKTVQQIDEALRVQREISGFLQLNQAAIGSTKLITDNVRQWKEGARGASPHSETESARIAASSLPPPPLS